MVGTVTVGIGVSAFGVAGACEAGAAGAEPGAAGDGAAAGGLAAGAPPVTRSTILLWPPAGLAAVSARGGLSLMARSCGFSFHRTAKPALIATAATTRISATHGHGLRRRGLCKPGAAGRPDSFAPLTGGAA